MVGDLRHSAGRRKACDCREHFWGDPDTRVFSIDLVPQLARLVDKVGIRADGQRGYLPADRRNLYSVYSRSPERRLGLVAVRDRMECDHRRGHDDDVHSSTHRVAFTVALFEYGLAYPDRPLSLARALGSKGIAAAGSRRSGLYDRGHLLCL